MWETITPSRFLKNMWQCSLFPFTEPCRNPSGHKAVLCYWRNSISGNEHCPGLLLPDISTGCSASKKSILSIVDLPQHSFKHKAILRPLEITCMATFSQTFCCQKMFFSPLLPRNGWNGLVFIIYEQLLKAATWWSQTLLWCMCGLWFHWSTNAILKNIYIYYRYFLL